MVVWGNMNRLYHQVRTFMVDSVWVWLFPNLVNSIVWEYITTTITTMPVRMIPDSLVIHELYR